MNHLDLFSGYGGFHLGLEEAGFKFDNVFYSEIDKHAIANYKYNFPEANYVGSVTDIQSRDLPRINSISFGSPCQDFSLAGKRKGLEGERSSLIGAAIKLIRELRPDFYIWENVKGVYSSNDGADYWAVKQAFADIDGYRLESQLLNTAWFLPQNRERIYLVGTLAESRRSSADIFPIGEKSGRTDERSERTTSARCLTAGGNSGGLHSSMTLIKTVATINSSQDGKVFCESGHSQTLSAGHGNVPKVQIKSANKKGFEEAKTGDSINLTQVNSKTRRGRVGKNKAQTLDTQCNQAVIVGTLRTHKDGEGFRETSSNLCPTIPARAREDGSGQPCVKVRVLTETRTEEAKKIRRETKDRDFSPRRGKKLVPRSDENADTITSTQTREQLLQIEDQEKNNIRRLTEIECERLQGLKDDHTKYGIYDGVKKEIPKTQRYKLCGNGVSIPTVKAVGEAIRKVIND